MGLAEKITQAKAEELAKQLEAKSKLQEIEDAKSKALDEVAIAIQQEDATLIAEMSPLLKVVGVRENLEEIRKIWGVGIVDTEPELLKGKDPFWIPTLALGIRFRFNDLEELSINVNQWGPGRASYYHNASVLYKKEAAIVVTVTKYHNMMSFFGTRKVDAEPKLYGSKYEHEGLKERWYSRALDRNYEIISISSKATFSEDVPVQAKKELEEQLFQLVLHTESPMILAAKARDRISQDGYIPSWRKLFS